MRNIWQRGLISLPLTAKEKSMKKSYILTILASFFLITACEDSAQEKLAKQTLIKNEYNKKLVEARECGQEKYMAKRFNKTMPICDETPPEKPKDL